LDSFFIFSFANLFWWGIYTKMTRGWKLTRSVWRSVKFWKKTSCCKT
jgi:hypothetical protein